jgi:tRNA (mo5U34)-methyltransferase
MRDETASAVDMALARLRHAVKQQLGVGRPPALEVDPESLVRFSPRLPHELDAETREALSQRAEELAPWLQGPFLLGGDLIVGGAWRNDQRWMGLGQQVPENLRGKRVLDVGSNAGYDPFMFHLRGADYVLACEPFAFYEQALFLESIYKTGVDFQQIGWQGLSSDSHGTFDVIHCHGVFYHEPEMMTMLSRLRQMLKSDGEMFFGTMMLADADLSEYVRFVPGAFYNDPTWWWVPGRLAMRWMLESAGFALGYEFGTNDGPPGDFRVVNGYFRVGAGEPSPALAYSGQ